jgi:hypothetical protein
MDSEVIVQVVVRHQRMNNLEFLESGTDLVTVKQCTSRSRHSKVSAFVAVDKCRQLQDRGVSVESHYFHLNRFHVQEMPIWQMSRWKGLGARIASFPVSERRQSQSSRSCTSLFIRQVLHSFLPRLGQYDLYQYPYLRTMPTRRSDEPNFAGSRAQSTIRKRGMRLQEAAPSGSRSSYG